jgi:hypothetical protein
MSFKISTLVREARADAFESTVGLSPIIKFFNLGAATIPAKCADADTGTAIASGTLPADWMNAASSAANVTTKTLKGTWTVTGIVAAGSGLNADYFRIYDPSGTTCHGQGEVTATGGGGVITLDNVNIANTQVATITSFTITESNG